MRQASVQTEIPVPEPDLTASEIIARADALKPVLRELQDDFERRGHPSADVHRRFRDAGFYRTLQPRRFGGYEFDVTTFWKAMLKVAEGDPGTGWFLTLASHHALVIGSAFSGQAQREMFGPDGEFRAPHRPAPRGRAVPAEGGYVVTGVWDYCSGAPYSTHFMGNALVQEDGRAPLNLLVVIPSEQVTMLDDWGNGALLGMQSTGSNSVAVDGAFVPTHWTVEWESVRAPGPTVGAALHQNPLYLGMLRSMYHGGLVLTMLGAAKASLDELEETLLTKQTHRPPYIPRYQDADLQRAFGLATALAASAEALLYQVGDWYTEYGRRWFETGQEFSVEDDVRLYTMLQQAGQLSVRAVDEVFAAASSSAARRGQRLQRYYRDVSMYRSHISAQYLSTATELARLHFGLPTTLP